jgi:hypothetical protein
MQLREVEDGKLYRRVRYLESENKRLRMSIQKYRNKLGLPIEDINV